MPFPDFDASTQFLVDEAYHAAWLILGGGAGWPAERRAATTAQITRQLIVAAEGGERDHYRLVQAATEGIDRP